MKRSPTITEPNACACGGFSGAGWTPLHLLLLALVPLLAYGNTFHIPFLFDDISSIVENPVIRDLSRFVTGEGRGYNPRRVVGYLSFALNYRVGGLDTYGYHLVNFAIHVLCGWIVYFLLRATLKTPFFGERGVGERLALLPLAVALLFVAHPVQTQAVTYIVQRLAALVTLFYLLALFCYAQGRLSLLSVTPRRGVRGAWVSAACFFLACALCALLAFQTKEVAATLPLAILLYEFAFFRGSRRRNLILAASLLLFSAVLGFAVLQAERPLGELLNDVNEMSRETLSISRGAYLLTQFRVIVTYLRLLVLPVQQNLDYDYPVYHSLFEAPVFFSFLALLTLSAAALWLLRRSARFGFERAGEGDPEELVRAQSTRLIAFGISWFFLTLAVESSVIPISDVIFEHRLYLPSFGALTALVAAALLISRNLSLRLCATACALVALLFAAATWQRNRVWESQLTLWGDVVAKSPGKSRANDHYGVALSAAGRTGEAIGFLKTALQIDPGNVYALYNLGRTFDAANEIDAAIGCYEAAVALKPDLVVAHNNLAVDYLVRGEEERAIERYDILLRMKPDFAEAHNNLGYVLNKRGRVEEAIGHLQAALKEKPKYVRARNNLGEAYLRKGELDLAVAQFQEAVRLKPDDPAARENLASALRKREGGRL